MTTTAVSEPPTITAPVADAKTELALVDLSSIAHPLWHMSGDKPDVDWTSQQIVERIRQLTANHPQAAVCCDSGRSFRNDLNATYKANRPEREAALWHQIALAKERLQADGYPVWSVRGFEADDLIATAATIALGMVDVSVLILSADKDLLQLVGPRVRAMNTNNGTIYDEAAVVTKLGIKPCQVCDYLTLVGDTSDNVKGASGIGAVKAAALLKQFGTLDAVYASLTTQGTLFKPAMATSLREFEPRMLETRSLIALRTDVDIPFIELDTPRVAKDAGPLEDTVNLLDMPIIEPAPLQAKPVETAPAAVQGTIEPAPKAEPQPAQPAQPSQALVTREPDVLAAAPAEFERQLEPRSLPQAMSLANHMHTARMFNGYGSPQAVLSTILAGRELGLPAIGSLRGFHVIEGKHSLSADAMRGLVLKSGVAKYFRVVQRTNESATFETWRKDDPEPVRLTYTIEEGWTAFKPELPEPERRKKWDASAWGKHPADMCAARASSKLARLVYADILFGLYSPEELRD